MKLCWDNIEDIRLSKNVNFRDMVKKQTYHLKECKQCREEFLARKNSKFCDLSCSNAYNKIGKKHSEETKKKISEANSGKRNFMYGKKHSVKIRKKISDNLPDMKKEKNSFWKGGYSKRGIPAYDTYFHQLEWCEEVRRNKEDLNILEVRCFKCDKWYIPKLNSVSNRLQYLKGNYKSEHRFYCSNECKNSCSIFNKSFNTIMKEDAIRAGRLPWLELRREIQPSLRNMVLERDDYMCIKCGSKENLQCHHILPINVEPLLSADVDNCITLCSKCHKKVHKEKDGCGYGQLRQEIC